jgi:4-alpha-glucanotransferase
VMAALGPMPRGAPPLVTAEAVGACVLAGRPGRYRLVLEGGAVQEGSADDAGGGRVRLNVPAASGYHRLAIGANEVTLASAPPSCWTIADATGGRRAWGLAVQLYALRRPGDGGLGDLAALRDLAVAAAKHGAAAIAISPIHAQFAALPGHFGPYSPSSRVRLNVLHTGLTVADIAEDRDGLIDWPDAAGRRMAVLRAAFDPADAGFVAYRRTASDGLESHARFEMLHALQGGRRWQEWPAELRSPDSAAVDDLARRHPLEVSFHAWLQWRAEASLDAAQDAARRAGMAIGLIADIAVGTDPSGSDAWCRQGELLQGLTVGAPPDLYNAGQDWGVSTFSPHGLVRNGFAGLLDLLRAGMAHAGGVRIDHAMGLARLWVVPHGMDAAEGAYIRFPLADMMRLIRLESRRHRAIVLGEDLGTLPQGFADRVAGEGMAGMRVLWFERDGDRLRAPADWTPGAAAMTSTHDLATVAGWWSGRDLAWRDRLGRLDADAQATRQTERAALWDAFTASGAASGPPPAPEEAAKVADAASAHIGKSGCMLALLPIEDALALTEQPNLPGTIDEHPNWRRRLPLAADELLSRPDVAARLAALNRDRSAVDGSAVDGSAVDGPAVGGKAVDGPVGGTTA